MSPTAKEDTTGFIRKISIAFRAEGAELTMQNPVHNME